MQDETLVCRDCGVDFIFSVGEQEFYAQKGYTNKPARCPTCRQKRKVASSEGGGGGGGGYGGGGGGYGGGGGGYGGGGGGYGGDRGGYGGPPRRGGERELFPATCAECGVETRVPFRPTQGKPVYCSDCFRSRPALR